MRVSSVFEEEVRRTAQYLFPHVGSQAPIILDGRERDGVFNTGESIHIIEATCDVRKLKAKSDLEKSIDLKRKLHQVYPNHNFHIWFITQNDPTADQAGEAEAAKRRGKCPVSAMSLTSFSQKFVNSSQYLSARNNYPFGSVRHLDPKSPNKYEPDGGYVPIDLVDSTDKSLVLAGSLGAIISSFTGPIVVTGGFGAGKSMTLRAAYYQVKADYDKNKTSVFPIFINLRDHIGQDDPSSALYDHGGKIGFTNPEQLVRAWRAGFAHIFLDGFDEIASSRFRVGAEGLKAVRRRAMILVRKFIEQHPFQRAGLIVSGRENYFGNLLEMSQAFGISRNDHKILSLTEFTIEQVKMYLQRLSYKDSFVPEWLPFRPLLVGYLATQGLFDAEGVDHKKLSRAESWDALLDRICEREGKQIDDIGGQADNVRDYVDRLATKARATTSGRGPLSLADMIDIFRQIFPSSPDETAQQLLVRLAGIAGSAEAPSGMTATSVDIEDSREFVDEDLVDVARAGDIFKFISHPYNDSLNNMFRDKNIVTTMGHLGLEVAINKLQQTSSGQICAALVHAIEEIESPYLSFEILRIMQIKKVPFSFSGGANRKFSLRDGYFESISFTSGLNMQPIVFQDCLIGRVDFDEPLGQNDGPVLDRCVVEEVYGVASRRDAPSHILLESTEAERYRNEVDTNNDVRRLPLGSALRVLVISLRKLFLQPGGGRQENAFVRGLDDTEKPYVNDVLDEIATAKFASLHRGVWTPNRVRRAEALSIIEAPSSNKSPLVEAVKKL